MTRFSHLFFAFVCLHSLAFHATGEVTLDRPFGDGMVLQRGKPVHLWGKAAGESEVTIRIQEKSATARVKDGKWFSTFPPLEASAEPDTLTIEGENSLAVSDVLVGEVWYAAGQSNMAFGQVAFREKPA